jgi:hypothetical protein|tara:strand:+ start:37 stop:204 length:168 start_codon:yes stop_codon:yes gene_type:complete
MKKNRTKKLKKLDIKKLLSSGWYLRNRKQIEKARKKRNERKTPYPVGFEYKKERR